MLNPGCKVQSYIASLRIEVLWFSFFLLLIFQITNASVFASFTFNELTTLLPVHKNKQQIVCLVESPMTLNAKIICIFNESMI